MYIHVRHLSQDSTVDLLQFLSNFFPKFKLLNFGCGLSANEAYMPVFTVSYSSVMAVFKSLMFIKFYRIAQVILAF